MGLFDSLTGAAHFDASDKTRAYLGQLQSNLAPAIMNSYTGAGDFARAGTADARKNLTLGFDASNGAITGGTRTAQDYLKSGADAAIGTLNAGGGAYVPLNDLAGDFRRGSTLAADALGINGADGNARAVSAFQAGPGYDFQMSQGLDAINRARNARGMANSGNTDVDALKFGQGQANQSYQQWLTNLAPYNTLALGATQGAAAGDAQNRALTANVQTGAGQNAATLAAREGTTLADIANRYYGNQAALDTSQGTTLGNLGIQSVRDISTLGQNIGKQFTDTYRADADAATKASANSLKLGEDLIKMAANAYSGGSFNLGNLFGGSASVADPTFGGWSLPGQSAASVRM